MPLPKFLTTVTPFSKALAMIIFILFPILAFFLGMAYQESITNVKIRLLEEKLVQLSRYPTPTPDYTDTANWNIFKNEENGFEIRYHTSWYMGATEEPTGEHILDWAFFNNGQLHKQLKSTSQAKCVPALQFFVYSSEQKFDYVNSQDLRKLENTNTQGIPMEIYKSNLDYCGYRMIGIVKLKNSNTLLIWLGQIGDENILMNTFNQILSTFKFIDNNPTPTCIPRPACLDATPQCLMPESENMCPPSARQSPPSPKPTGQTVCTQDAKLCPDGSYVGRTGPNCEFAKCP